MVQDLTATETVAQGIPFLPELSIIQWGIIGFFFLLFIAAVALVIWAVWNLILKPKNQDFYKDSYRELIANCKNNCPIELKGKKFRTSPDETHAGVEKGITCGYNLIEFSKKHYDLIVYNPKPFKFLDVASWFSQDRIAAMNAEHLTEKTGKKIKKKIDKIIIKDGIKQSITEEIEVDEIKEKRDRHNRPIYKHHSALIGDLDWFTIGTERIGYFEYAVNDLNLTPDEVREELKERVNLTAETGVLKQMGNIVGEALHANAAVRRDQKLKDEIPLGKR